jgi:hypothetical protein
MQSLPFEGRVFGRLTIVRRSEMRNMYWWCQCSCGSLEKEIYRSSLISGATQSCGCIHKEVVSRASKTHGMSKTKIYRLWSMMLDRCRNPRNTFYGEYGGRGICVCESWLKFQNFYADMGEKPEGKSLDRINNNGCYSPENCRWASRVEQARNRRNNRMVTYKGKSQSLSAWAEELNANFNTLNTRAQRGWSDERIIATPIKKVSVN